MIMRRWRNSRTLRSLNRLHLIAIVGLLCLRTGFELPVPAEDGPPAEKQVAAPVPPIGQFLTISGTVDDSVLRKANRAARALHTRSPPQQRRGTLGMEIPPGSTPVH